ncbi:MAG TPA: hypothetical protein VGE31_00310 [Candidatus Paceibacterota bacterium]
MDPYLNNEPTRNRNKAGNSNAIVIGVVALVIVLIAWWAFSNRAADDLTPGDVDQDTILGDPEEDGNDLINNATTSASRAATQAEIAAARAEARTELLAIQARLEAEENYDEAVAEVEAVEADLERTYANATGEVKQEWEETKAEFDKLEQNIRNGSATTLDVLAGLLLMFSSEVRTDEE